MTSTPTPSRLALRLLGCAAALAAASPAARAEAPEASFTAVGPAGLKFTGKTGGVQAATEGDNLVVTVALKGLDTGLDLRNKHMREKYLQVDKYPNAVFTVPWSAIKRPESGDVEAEASGTLTIHGQTKPTKVRYKASKSGSNYAVDGSLKLDLRDFGIEVPSYLGVTVKPEIDAQARFTIAAR